MLVRKLLRICTPSPNYYRFYSSGPVNVKEIHKMVNQLEIMEINRFMEMNNNMDKYVLEDIMKNTKNPHIKELVLDELNDLDDCQFDDHKNYYEDYYKK